MIDLEDEFKTFALRVIEEKGDLNFMALVRRGDLRDSWDITIAARWASASRSAAIKYLIDTFKVVYGADLLRYIARIVILNPEDTSVREYTAKLSADGKQLVEEQGEFFGVDAAKTVVVSSARAA